MMRAALLAAVAGQTTGAALVDVEQVRSRLPSLLRLQREPPVVRRSSAWRSVR